MNVGYVTLQYQSPNQNWIPAGQCVYVFQIISKRLDDLKKRHPNVPCRAIDTLGRLVDMR